MFMLQPYAIKGKLVFTYFFTWTVFLVGICTIQAQQPTSASIGIDRPLVGALRWDAWHQPEKGYAAEQVEYALSQKHYHWRAPFFSEITSDTSISLRGYGQEVIDQEIAYAYEMGLDYWAFLLYDEDTPLHDGLTYYLNSGKKDSINFCAMVNIGRTFMTDKGDAGIQEGVDRLISYFGEDSYQMVQGNRPLVYFFRPNETWISKMGGQSKVDDMLESLETRSLELGLGKPYIVVMHYDQEIAVSMLESMNADALSTYAVFSEEAQITHSFDTLAQACEAFWDTYADTGYSVVPTAMTGWDRRPRIERPMSWQSNQKPRVGIEKYVQAPTDIELKRHIKQAIDWSVENDAEAVLIYAWNEHDEGGWLCPTINSDNTINTSRLDALKEILR